MLSADAWLRVFTNRTLKTEKAFAKALEIKEAVAIMKKQCGGRLV